MVQYKNKREGYIYMNKETEEYSSLRQEINSLCSTSDTIIYILYVFLAPYLCFALAKEDTIYILLTHVVILPLYLLAIDRRIATCKISAYISVFLEEEGNKWETRQRKFKTKKQLNIFKYFSAKHFSFMFSNFLVLMIYIYKTKWVLPMPYYELVKFVFEILFFSIINIIFVKYRKIVVEDYITSWKEIKENENYIKQEEYLNFFQNMSEEAKSTIFKIIIQQAKEEYKNTGKNPFKLK